MYFISFVLVLVLAIVNFFLAFKKRSASFVVLISSSVCVGLALFFIPDAVTEMVLQKRFSVLSAMPDLRDSVASSWDKSIDQANMFVYCGYFLSLVHMACLYKVWKNAKAQKSEVS